MIPRRIFSVFLIIQWQNAHGQSKFSLLARTEYFIDKSEMIKVFFDPARVSHHFITCPSGFGKSTNLQMLKLFANIVVDKNGSEVNYNQTEAFQVFKNSKIVKSNSGGEFIQRHMTQYPILHLELATNKSILEINDDDDVVSYLNERLYFCFKDYEWLLRIPKEQFVRRKRSDFIVGTSEMLFMEKLNQRNLNKSEAVLGLQSLCRILKLYFHKKVIVLVDQYDHLINSDAIWNSNRSVSRIYTAVNSMLRLAFESARFVDNWLVTGTSSMPFRGSYLTCSNFNHHSFLNEHLFTRYFGFSENEMKKLFTKFKCSFEEKLDVKEYYNGYTTRGTRTPLYNPKSVVRYFTARNSLGRKHLSSALNSYWSIRKEKEFLLVLLKNLPGFKTDLKKLIKHEPISFKPTKNFFKKDLRVFHDLKITDKNFYIKHYNLAMSFLFEHGYLAPTLEKINEYTVPNNEISMELELVLEEFTEQRKKWMKFIGFDYSLVELSLCQDSEFSLE